MADTMQTGLVNCDWLALSCMAVRPFEEDTIKAADPVLGWRIFEARGTNVWKYRYILYDFDGNKVATILARPLSPLIDARRVCVELANRRLYGLDPIGDAERITDWLNLKVTGISRLDVCCDFELTPRLAGIVDKMATGDVYVGRYRTGSCWWRAATNTRGRSYNCLTWGSKTSGVDWKLYYKSLELEEAEADSKKPYIVDQWATMGWDVANVWRLEVSLRQVNGFDFAGYGRGDWKAWLTSLGDVFRSMYTTCFITRLNQGHADKRNDTAVTFLDVEGMRLITRAKSRVSRDCSDPERRLVRKLWMELQQADTLANESMVGWIKRLLRDALADVGLFEYVCRTFEVTPDEVFSALAECS